MGGGLLFSFFDGLLDYRKGHKLFLFNIISSSLVNWQNQFSVIDNFKDSQSFLLSLDNDQRRCSCHFTFVQVFATYYTYQTKGINFMKDSNKFAYYFEQRTLTNTTGTVTKKLAKAYTKTSVTNCNIKQ